MATKAPKVVKKKTPPFKRHHSDRYIRVGTSWRLQKGIDSCVRRRFRGTIKAPKIGYGNDKRTRFLNKQGKRVITVSTIKDLDALLMEPESFAAEIAHNISARNRVALVTRAKAIGVKVTNPKGRVTLEA